MVVRKIIPTFADETTNDINVGLRLEPADIRKQGITKMETNHNIDTTKAYLIGMLWAAYGVKIFSDSVAEWQIDKVKECAKKLKEAEINHSSFTQMEKKNQKHQWKQWIDVTTQGFKDILKEEGRLI